MASSPCMCSITEASPQPLETSERVWHGVGDTGSELKCLRLNSSSTTDELFELQKNHSVNQPHRVVKIK